MRTPPSLSQGRSCSHRSAPAEPGKRQAAVWPASVTAICTELSQIRYDAMESGVRGCPHESLDSQDRWHISRHGHKAELLHDSHADLVCRRQRFDRAGGTEKIVPESSERFVQWLSRLGLHTACAGHHLKDFDL